MWRCRESSAAEQSGGQGRRVGYGLFIPVFFVAPAMSLDLHSIIESPIRLIVFRSLSLAARGLPAPLFHRHVLPRRRRVQMLLTATRARCRRMEWARWSG